MGDVIIWLTWTCQPSNDSSNAEELVDDSDEDEAHQEDTNTEDDYRYGCDDSMADLDLYYGGEDGSTEGMYAWHNDYSNIFHVILWSSGLHMMIVLVFQS